MSNDKSKVPARRTCSECIYFALGVSVPGLAVPPGGGQCEGVPGLPVLIPMPPQSKVLVAGGPDMGQGFVVKFMQPIVPGHRPRCASFEAREQASVTPMPGSAPAGK